jgi:hypothetical protein
MDRNDYPGGYENGNDWLIDLAIEEHYLREHMQNEKTNNKES